MYGTLAGALAGRKVAFDRSKYTATVDGHITGVGKTIRISSIVMHYDLTVPADAREAAERALAVHPAGCPAHESVKDALEAGGAPRAHRVQAEHGRQEQGGVRRRAARGVRGRHVRRVRGRGLLGGSEECQAGGAERQQDPADAEARVLSLRAAAGRDDP